MSHLHRLASYNLWANKKICKFILDAGDSIADETIKSSFHSIRKTLYHTWDAQVIWSKRLHGDPANTWPSHNFTGSLSEAASLFIESSEDYVRFTEKMNDSAAESIITYKALDGTAYVSSVEEIIMHVMNHGTFHRGQLISMLRIAGADQLGSTDMIRFFREQK
jgi:uncharacterized damage-inducible protein DinB